VFHSPPSVVVYPPGDIRSPLQQETEERSRVVLGHPAPWWMLCNVHHQERDSPDIPAHAQNNPYRRSQVSFDGLPPALRCLPAGVYRFSGRFLGTAGRRQDAGYARGGATYRSGAVPPHTPDRSPHCPRFALPAFAGTKALRPAGMDRRRTGSTRRLQVMAFIPSHEQSSSSAVAPRRHVLIQRSVSSSAPPRAGRPHTHVSHLQRRSHDQPTGTPSR
jgi:hypothetical protein